MKIVRSAVNPFTVAVGAMREGEVYTHVVDGAPADSVFLRTSSKDFPLVALGSGALISMRTAAEFDWVLVPGATVNIG